MSNHERIRSDVAALLAQPAGTGLTLAVAVMVDGELVAEGYAPSAGPDVALVSWSMAKSVTHALVGLLVGDGRLDPAQPAGVASWADGRSVITLDDLLTMSSGLRFVEDYVDAGRSGGSPLALRRDPAVRAVIRERFLCVARGGCARASAELPGSATGYRTVKGPVPFSSILAVVTLSWLVSGCARVSPFSRRSICSARLPRRLNSTARAAVSSMRRASPEMMSARSITTLPCVSVDGDLPLRMSCSSALCRSCVYEGARSFRMIRSTARCLSRQYS